MECRKIEIECRKIEIGNRKTGDQKNFTCQSSKLKIRNVGNNYEKYLVFSIIMVLI